MPSPKRMPPVFHPRLLVVGAVAVFILLSQALPVALAVPPGHVPARDPASDQSQKPFVTRDIFIFPSPDVPTLDATFLPQRPGLGLLGTPTPTPTVWKPPDGPKPKSTLPFPTPPPQRGSLYSCHEYGRIHVDGVLYCNGPDGRGALAASKMYPLTFEIRDPDTDTALMLFPKHYDVLVGDNGIFSVDLKVADSCQGPGLTDIPDPRTVIKPGTTLTYCSDESCTCHNPEGSEYKVAFAPLAVRADVASKADVASRADVAITLEPGARIESSVANELLILRNDFVDKEHGSMSDWGGDGIVIEQVTESGINVANARHGISIQHVEENGIGIADAKWGVWIDNARSSGVHVGIAGEHGVEVNSAKSDGLHVGSANKNGVYVKNAGQDGVAVISAEGTGLSIGNASRRGIHVGSTGGTGVVVDKAYDHGLYVGDAGQDGVRVESAGRYAGYFNGRVRVNVLEITGGSDLAESFEIVDEESVQPGMVVAIDPRTPGSLRIADQPYDRTVAGIISGAGDISPGMVMGQSDSDAAEAMPVALSGRVYCNVDATYGAIQPGDLLTTSPTPGYAMVVKDYARAQGAILGKAMQGLPEGQKGQILVLVTLQ